MTSYPRPVPGTYAPYFDAYIARVSEADPIAVMEAQYDELATFMRGLPSDKLNFSYAPGKWTPKEILGHLTDTERVMSYRALRFARGDQAPLATFDENAWMGPAEFSRRSLDDLLDEWLVVRHASLALFRSLPEAGRTRGGTASNRPLTVPAIVFLLPGHVRHHLAVVRERYL